MDVFADLMDSCKQSLKLSRNNAKIFIPLLFSRILIGVMIVVLIITLLIALGGVAYISITNIKSGELTNRFNNVIVPIAILFFSVIFLIIPIINSMIEAGLLGMMRSALLTGKCGGSNFFASLRKNWLKILWGNILVYLLLALLFIPTIIVLILVQILTLGWGFLIVFTISVFFGNWTTILVIDEETTTKAIFKGINFGKKYFGVLFILAMGAAGISNYVFGLISGIPFVGILGASMVTVIIATYFKLVLVNFYVNIKAI